MQAKVTLDYGPLSLSDIKDEKGNPAQIDGPAGFRVTPPEAGEILTAQGDPRQNPDGTPVFPDGSQFFRSASTTGVTGVVEAYVDPNLDPNVTEEKVIAQEPFVTVAGDASVGTLNLGAGVPQP